MGIGSIFKDILGVEELVREVGTTVRQVLPNKEAQRAFDLELAKMADVLNARLHQEAMMQMEINKEEAKNASVFVSGWRPAIGWVCVSGLAWNFVISPFLVGIGLTDAGTLNIEYLLTLCLTMLGASGIRSFELNKGVARDSLRGPRLAAPVAAARQLEEADDNNLVPTDEGDAPWNRK